jgi:hypothetical protein
MTTDSSHPSSPPRRLKTYTGGQGYVYQYYFVGQRVALAADPYAPSTEFIFDVTADRKTTFAVSVFLQEQAVRSWNATHQRALTDAEQYGAAKMRLFQAFDQVEDMMMQGRRLLLDQTLLSELLKSLRVE